MTVLGPDVSFYQDNDETPQMIDFNKMKSNGASFVIIRAGQNRWVDPDFSYNWNRAKQAGLPRGSYWFYDSRTDPVAQAKLYVDQHKGDFGELPLWADFEEKYNGPFIGLKNWLVFLEELGKLTPRTVEIGIYTNFYYWRENVPAQHRGQFEGYPLWIANYNPGSPLIPDPWTTWLFHQYTDNGPGKAFGAESNRIDLNYFNGNEDEFKARFSLGDLPEEPLPPINTRYLTHKGVEVNIVERFGSKCIIHIIDPKIARVYVSPGGFRTVGAAVDKYAAQIGVNGGGWPNEQTPGHRANEIWCSDGMLIQGTAIDNRGYINVNTEGVPSVSETSKLMAGLRNAWGYDRILGKDGQFNTKISDRVTKDARTGSGVTSDGKLIILSTEGNDRFTRGLSFPEMWEVLEEFGAIIAGNNDGGSSSAVINKALSNDSLILPSDGVQAPVINQVLIFSEPIIVQNPDPDPNPEIPMTDFFVKVTVEQKERAAPSMYNQNSRTGQPVGTVIKVPGKVPADPDLKDNLIKDTDSRSDALFVRTSTGYYQPAFYQGKWNVVEVPDPSLPTDPEVPFPGDVQDLTLTLSGIVLGKVVLNGEEWVRKI